MTKNNNNRSTSVVRWHAPLLAATAALLLSACAGIAPLEGGETALPSSTTAASAHDDHAAAVPSTPQPATPQAAVADVSTMPAAAAAADANQPFFPLPMITDAGPSIRFSRRRSGVDPSLDDDASDDKTIPGTEIDRGTASWYGLQFHGRRTANGERYDMYELTAAHKTLPFNTIVHVKSLQTGRTVRVRINDRGPFVRGRVIDLSKAAAEELGMTELGIKPVSLTVAEWPDGTLGDERDEAAPAPKRKRTIATARR